MELNNPTRDIENNEILRETSHLSWLYQSDDEFYAMFVPYLTLGLNASKQCVLAVPRHIRDQAIERLTEAGIDVVKGLESGQLLMVDPEKLFFREEGFDGGAAIKDIEEASREAVKLGWRGLSVVTDVSMFIDRAPVERWAAYEFAADDSCVNAICTMICFYDARLIPGTLVTMIMKSHPVVGMGMSLMLNPFYVNAPAMIGEN